MTANRQLAAILFTDIEGYTAIMQQDEHKALAMKNRHREILQKEHKSFNGRIIQYYGDGTLSIFSSVVEAVHCAVIMQQGFCKWPQVPVRMGLHFGDIIFNDEHVFGDGINLASRIESLSVAGSVLISDKVNEEISNHPGLKTVSVGNYQLKNIERNVEVFALTNENLVIPAINTLKGKTSEKKSEAQQPSKKLRLRHKSVAVLPFRNISNDNTIEWLSNGFTEELTSAIACISDLKVKSSTTMLQYKNADKNFNQIAEELNAANFVEGTVQKHGNDILINANLINSKTGEILRPFRFKKDFSEIHFIYSQMAQEVAEQLNVILHSSEKQKLEKRVKVNPDVYQYYLQGRYAAQKLDLNEINGAIINFEKALQIEPAYAPALAGIANCYVAMGYLNIITPFEALEKSMPLLENALQIDPNNAFAHSNLGWARMWFQWDLKNAETEFFTGNELDPSETICIQGIFFLNLYNGNTNKAEYWQQNGLIVVPNDMWLNHFYGLLLFYQNKISEAIVVFKDCTLRYGHILNYGRLGWIYILTGKYQDAISIIEKGLSLFSVRRPSVLAWLAAAYFKNGEVEKAMDILKELENGISAGKPNHAFYTGVTYAFIGKNEDAFRLLNKSYELHDLDMLWLKQEPLLDPVKNDPRYLELLEKVGFYNSPDERLRLDPTKLA